MINPEEFEEFMRDYQNMVYTTAMRLLGNEADAADISQEAFLKAFEHFAELRCNPRAGGWLKKVTTNLSLNHLSRYRSRWRLFSEMFSGNEEDEDYSATVTAPGTVEAASDTVQRQQMLEAALQKLPSAQRVPLVLFHFEGMNYEQIASRLGISLGKVKTDIHRGRLTLRRRLAWRDKDEL